MRPFFSVLVPTRNRSTLLRYAIESILEQGYGDYEVVISDNNSTDNTAQVVASFSDQRVKYYKSDHDLSLIDNWNNTYLHSQGQYLIMIGDDDFLLPYALERYAEPIKSALNARILFSRSAVYTYPDHPQSKYRNTVLHARYPTGKVKWIEARTLLRNIFGFHYPLATQTICYSKELLEEISWKGVPFHPPFPDHFSAGASLLRVPSVILIDSHLIVMGKNTTSSGVGCIYSQDRANRWAGEQMQPSAKFEIDGKSQLIDGNYFLNGYYNTLQLLKQVYSDLACEYTPKMRGYYDISGYQMRSAKKHGASMGQQAEQQLKRYRATLPIADRITINFRNIVRDLRDIMPLRIHNLAELCVPRDRVIMMFTKMPDSITNIQECTQYCIKNDIL